jgi:hypothetical protein
MTAPYDESGLDEFDPDATHNPVDLEESDEPTLF